MSLESSLLAWVEILEAEHGLPAKPQPATAAEIAELEDYWECDIRGELRELLEFSNGLFVEERAGFFPFTVSWPAMPFDKMAPGSLPYKPLRFDDEASQIEHGTPALTEGKLVYLGVNDFEIAVMSGGSADGAVVSTDWGGPGIDWSARQLSELFDNFCWYHERGYFKFTKDHPGWPFSIAYIKGAREQDDVPSFQSWSIMPYEPKPQATVCEWRWDS